MEATSKVLKSLVIVGFALLLIFSAYFTSREQQFVFLAESFLKGKLYFLEKPNSWSDTSLFQGRYYWPLGPAPAMILLPLILLFGRLVTQGSISLFLTLLNAKLLQLIALKVTKKTSTALWLSFAYLFGSAHLYVAIVPWSWYFAQVVATTFLLLSLKEWLSQRRWFWLGLYLSLAVATRVNLALAAVFFAGDLLLSHQKAGEKIKALARFFTPVLVTISLLLLYNFARFRQPLEFGYHYQLISGETLANRNYGLWNPIHFPANFYYLFLKGPEGNFLPGTKILTFPFILPSVWGMSIFLTTPIFLWLVKASIKEKPVRLAWLTSLVMLLFILGNSGIGRRQYGYRYALDFYPFLYLILCFAFKDRPLTKLVKVVIVASFLFNLYLIPFTLTQPLV